MGVIELVERIKSRQIKQNSQEWFNSKVAKKYESLINYLKNQKSNLHIHKIYTMAQYDTHKLISYNKKHFLKIDSMVLLVNLKKFERL